MDEVPPWDDAPDEDLADLIEAKRASMTDEQRAELDHRREAVLAAEGEPVEKLGEEAAREVMLEALAEAWPDGVRAKDLQRIATRSSSWFYPVANAWAEEGIVRRTEHGTWALVAAPPQAVNREPAHAV